MIRNLSVEEANRVAGGKITELTPYKLPHYRVPTKPLFVGRHNSNTHATPLYNDNLFHYNIIPYVK